ncbi:MAG: non-homologous end-joining DNA ligase [Candidatus Nanopelagicales bacterium]
MTPGPTTAGPPGDGEATTVSVGGRTLRVTFLDKVMYPETGTTKAELLQYAVGVADAVLPLVRDRPVTRIRWPHGVAQESFFEKNIPAGVPDWVARVALPTSGRRSGKGPGEITYPLVDEVATLAWFVQTGALEWHAPQWRVDRGAAAGTDPVLPPDRLVLDLDPGPPAGLRECAEVALVARRMLVAHGMDPVAVTSGRKGMQLYAPLPPGNEQGRDVLARAGSTSDYAHALGEALVRAFPALVITRMAREARPGKVFVDWSQNNPGKTTICPWSLRGTELPTVATPVTWDEVEAGTLAHATYDEALRRLARGIDPTRGLR